MTGDTIASTFVDIVVNLGPLASALAVARSKLAKWASTMASLMRKAGERIAGAIVAPFRAVGAMIKGSLLGQFAALAAVAAPGIAFKRMVTSAADLNETISALEVVFGKAAATVKRESDSMAEAFGIPHKMFMDATMEIGALGKASGQSQAEAAKFGMEMTKLAMDLSSMRNMRFEDALQKIHSGLVGEAEPLRAVGVLLSEATVKQEALRLGLIKGKQEMTEAQKVTARASIITKQLADAQGDLERTQDSVSNQWREMEGRLTILATKLGQYLLPAVQTFNDQILGVFQATDFWVKKNEESFKAWGKTLQAAAEFLGAIFHDFDLVKKLLMAKGIEIFQHIQSVFATLYTNLELFAERFSKILTDAIEDAIDKLKGAPAKLRPPRAPIIWARPNFAPNPDVDRFMNLIGARARVRGWLGDKARQAGKWLKGRAANRRPDPWQEAHDQFNIDQNIAIDHARQQRKKALERARIFHPPHPQGQAGPGGWMFADDPVRGAGMGPLLPLDDLGRPFGPAARAARLPARGPERITPAPGARAMAPLGMRPNPQVRLPLGMGELMVNDPALQRMMQRNRAGVNAAQRAQQAASNAALGAADEVAKLQAQAAGKGPAAKRAKDALRQMEKQGKAQTKAILDGFDVDFTAPAEMWQKIQTSLLGKGKKDPNETTAENTTKMLTEMILTKAAIENMDTSGKASGPE